MALNKTKPSHGGYPGEVVIRRYYISYGVSPELRAILGCDTNKQNRDDN